MASTGAAPTVGRPTADQITRAVARPEQYLRRRWASLADARRRRDRWVESFNVYGFRDPVTLI